MAWGGENPFFTQGFHVVPSAGFYLKIRMLVSPLEQLVKSPRGHLEEDSSSHFSAPNPKPPHVLHTSTQEVP